MERAEGTYGKAGKGLVILHLDGVGHTFLGRAIEQGRMPAVARLIEEEGYESLSYRCGIPSTTPFCQAGILYGDNSEIPSYRWWDKQAGILVAFGHGSSFKKVAHRYFRGSRPLTEGGAVIGSCFPAGAKETFGLAYRERDASGPGRAISAAKTIASFFASPLRLADWLRHGGWAVARTSVEAIRAQLAGRPAAAAYVVSDMLEEIFLHHVARYAVVHAMDRNLPIIYAGFYAYDETAHGFGPEHPYCYEMLKHVDETIAEIAGRRRGREGTPSEYELVVLSDHGQDQTAPFHHPDGRTLGEIVSELLPTYQVTEYKGRSYGPKGEPLDGHVALTYSGGLAHLYFKDIKERLDAKELDQRFPGLLESIAAEERVAFLLVRDGRHGLLLHGDGRLRLDGREAAALLARYDDGPVLAGQLQRLNSFERSGDVVIFGDHRDGRQFNFEHQVGGHGSVGGEQVKPFLLAKREWALDLGGVRNSSDLHPILCHLRDRLAQG